MSALFISNQQFIIEQWNSLIRTISLSSKLFDNMHNGFHSLSSKLIDKMHNIHHEHFYKLSMQDLNICV